MEMKLGCLGGPQPEVAQPSKKQRKETHLGMLNYTQIRVSTQPSPKYGMRTIPERFSTNNKHNSKFLIH